MFLLPLSSRLSQVPKPIRHLAQVHADFERQS